MTVFRVVRMTRVMILFKFARKQAKVYFETMKASLRTMYVLLLIDIIGSLVFATLIYYAERGKYDNDLKVWMRPESFTCEVIVRRVYDSLDSATTTSMQLYSSNNNTSSQAIIGFGDDCIRRGWDGTCCIKAEHQPQYLADLNSVMLLCPLRHNNPDLRCTVNYAQVMNNSVLNNYSFEMF